MRRPARPRPPRGSAATPVTSEANSEKPAPVADSTFATLSVEGQRALPSAPMRFEGLKAVASSAALRARPEAESPFSAASASSARQISSCVMASFLPGLRPVHHASLHGDNILGAESECNRLIFLIYACVRHSDADMFLIRSRQERGKSPRCPPRNPPPPAPPPPLPRA